MTKIGVVTIWKDETGYFSTQHETEDNIYDGSGNSLQEALRDLADVVEEEMEALSRK
jgi:hypothetical protein